MPVHALPNIRNRLKLFDIGEDTKHAVSLYRPLLSKRLDGLVSQFHQRLAAHPEARHLFADPAVRAKLTPKQKAHWEKLFSCSFDAAYVHGAIDIGRAHYRLKIAPYVYLAGYHFLHGRMIEIACEKYRGSGELPRLLTAIAALIALDTDLALSAYAQAYWRDAPQADAVILD